MAPQDGFEPPAKRLTVACSTAELLGITLFKLDNQTCSPMQEKRLVFAAFIIFIFVQG
tara:strand:- start:156 stop:329 length:174 start_codon:yes stop_codon:yes gene_type:complete